MRKFVVGFSILGAVFFVGMFYYKNLRGVGPAIKPPAADISALLETRTQEQLRDEHALEFPLVLSDGFSLSVFAKDIGAPRVLAWDPAGTLVASIPSAGTVVALPDTDKDGKADETITLAEGLNRPHGIAFFEGRLFVAETNKVIRYDYDAKSMRAFGPHKLFDLPDGGNHVTRTIGLGPDKKLYVSVGSSCNVCEEKDWQRAKILVSQPDGTDLQEFASGLRNSVFFIWHPTTGEMWATDMGRDLLGDNLPPEEVNIVRKGGDYGWPYCYGNRVHDSRFDPGKTRSCEETVPPHISFQAHSAPLGLAFIPDSWPAAYKGDLLVSYHGSWNRSVPTGYKVARFDLDNGNAQSDFVSGWLGSSDSRALGRPVDLLFDQSGNLYVSDDKAGVIYKISQK